MRLNRDRLNFTLILFLHLLLASGCSTDLKRIFNLPPDTTSDNLLHHVDQLIKLYAFRALLGSRKGAVYEVPLPESFQPVVQVQAVRLDTARLHHRGFIFNEVAIPPGVSVTVSGFVPESVVLVYRYFNMRFSVYCLENRVSIVGPVVGVKAYSNSLFAANADVVAGENPIMVRIPVPFSDSSSYCAFFDENGNATVTSMAYVNVCSMEELVDATLVKVSPRVSNGGGISPSPRVSPREVIVARGSSRRLKLAILSCSAVGAACLFGAFAVTLGVRAQKACFLARMERLSAENEALDRATISQSSRPPRARTIRTRPALERDYMFK